MKGILAEKLYKGRLCMRQQMIPFKFKIIVWSSE